MSNLEALILGIVQGLTEFLPVSSSGHLVLVGALLGVRDESGLLFEVALHVATLFAIAIFYRRRIAELLAGLLGRDPAAFDYCGKLGVATLPAVLVGLTAKDAIDRLFGSALVAAVLLVVTGAILWSTRWTLPRARAAAPSWAVAVAIGVAQAFAILPGISRSGTTVACALALGVAPLAAAEFSFLLGIIAIAGAAVLMLPEVAAVPPGLLPALGVGSAAALASGVAAIWTFVWLLQRQTFHVFAWYVWVVGAGAALFLLAG